MRFPNILAEYEAALDATDREPDGLLHCSKHIWWPVRFSQLEAVGTPTEPLEFLDRINMLTGTLHHTFIESWLKKRKDRWWELIASEVDLTPYLPTGWTGTADWVFFDKEADHFILGDLKTIKPEAIQYLQGIKKDHLLQLSCYYTALQKAGYNMAPEIFVFYLPKSRLWSHRVIPQQPTSTPLTGMTMVMNAIKDRVDRYKNEGLGLEPMPDPSYKYSWNKLMSVFDVKEHPDWRELYTCPFNEQLCPRTKVRKIGHWTLDKKWVTKYSEYKTGSRFPKPSEAEFNKRR